MESATKYSWEQLDEGFDPLGGPVSRGMGFMHDPLAMNQARVVLPAAWRAIWRGLPDLFIQKRVRDLILDLEPLDVDAIRAECRHDPLSFMKTKSVVFCMAQACIDFDRVIAEHMKEPEPLPAHVQAAIAAFAGHCLCPDYCALADMSLTASVLVQDKVDLSNCTFDDFKLICPVNNAPTAEEAASGDLEPARVRGQAENRFHNTPTMMEYRVHDLVDIVATTQRLIHDYRAQGDGSPETDEQRAVVDEILRQIQRAKDAFKRLRMAFALLSKRTVDPVVWHRDIVKYTSGYGGHLGLSGPQAPSIHLIDAFLGRKKFDTELGQTSMKAFSQIQHNHRVFIRSVAAGPQLRQFAQECNDRRPDHPVAAAFNDLVDSYTKGFLAVHKSRAVEFAKKGFGEAGPREFTAETEYKWPATHNVVTKLRGFFDAAIAERASLNLARDE